MEETPLCVPNRAYCFKCRAKVLIQDAKFSLSGGKRPNRVKMKAQCTECGSMINNFVSKKYKAFIVSAEQDEPSPSQ